MVDLLRIEVLERGPAPQRDEELRGTGLLGVRAADDDEAQVGKALREKKEFTDEIVSQLRKATDEFKAMFSAK